MTDGPMRMQAEREALIAASECQGAHDVGEMVFPGTSQQGVVCRRCKRFLPC